MRWRPWPRRARPGPPDIDTRPCLRAAGPLTVALAIVLAIGASAAPGAEPRKSATAKAASRKPTTSLDPREEQQRQASERARLTERIGELRKQIAAGERSRAGAATALQRAERELAVVSERLRVLDERRRGLDERVAALDRQRSTRESELTARRRQLVATAVELEVHRGADPLRDALLGRDATPLAVDALLDHAAHAHVDEIRRLQGQVVDLQAQRQAADDEQAALLAQAREQRTAQDALLSDRVAQRNALAQLSSRLAEQRRSASALEADEKRLSRVVEALQRAIDRAAEERARREVARKRDEDRRAKPDASTKPRATPRPEPEPEPPVAASGAFGRLRGALPLPTRGTIAARYGAPRGDDGGSWKGLFIRTADGADVRAIATGQVVFADYLRGFGNLVIVDHGGQYLSIYGNNAAVTRKAGDRVSAGDVVAHAGNSSGDDQTGLYFELRFRGRPFDPAGWLGGR